MDEPGILQNAKRGKSKFKSILKVSKRGGCRSKNNRVKKQNKVFKFSIWGTNSAGLKAKRDSLIHNITLFNNPSIITIQESKLRITGNFKLKKYKVFENNPPGARWRLAYSCRP